MIVSQALKFALDSVIDGQGQLYWDGKGGNGTPKPQFFTIEAFDSVFHDVFVLNSPKDVVQVTNSINVEFYNWLIDDAAGDKVIEWSETFLQLSEPILERGP